jgi:acetylornithine deacetylase/succinyl-diaminopimelate desuccinylase-like protein
MPIDLLTSARALIAIDSRSSLSDRALVDYLAPLCAQAGLRVSLQSESRDGVPQYDIVAVRGPGPTRPHDPEHGPDPRQEPDALLMATHLDTVPPGDESLWTRCDGRPFELAQDAGILYGLGVADVKLDFLCKLLALERLKDTRLQRPVVLAGTYGEEVGRWGAALLTRSLEPLPSTVLVGEPTGLRPCTAHKGYVEIVCRAMSRPVPVDPGPCWSLRFDGVAAHSSQPHKGVSANDACLDALSEHWAQASPPILDLNGGELVNKVAAAARMIVRSDRPPQLPGAQVEPVACPERPSWSPDLVRLAIAVHRLTVSLRANLLAYPVDGFDPPQTTVNNGLVHLRDGELAHTVDVRRVPGPGPSAALDAHLERLRGLGAAGLAVDCVLDAAPFAAAADSRIVADLEAVLAARAMPTSPELKSGTTEATVYAQAGMDVVVFGPGVAGGNIHKPNERVPLADLHAATDIYEALILRFCS